MAAHGAVQSGHYLVLDALDAGHDALFSNVACLLCKVSFTKSIAPQQMHA